MISAILHAAATETTKPVTHPGTGRAAGAVDLTRHIYRHPALAPLPLRAVVAPTTTRGPS